jgi:integrase
LACVRQLSEFYSKSPELVSAEGIRQYCIHLKTHKKVARQTSTQAICAIKLFWEKTLRRPWPHELELARANPQFKLPVVLSASEVRRILAAVPALDHRVCLTTIYSCGLRLGEGLSLEVRDIDAERMLVHIRSGKGRVKGFASRGLMRQRMLLKMMRQLTFQETSAATAFEILLPPLRIFLFGVRFVIDQPPRPPERCGEGQPSLMLCDTLPQVRRVANIQAVVHLGLQNVNVEHGIQLAGMAA